MTIVKASILLLCLALPGTWCYSMGHKLQIDIQKITELDSIPAGSGLLLQKDSLYIISDNAPAYYKLDIATLQYKKIAIKGYGQEMYELPKRNKHDFESSVQLNIKGKDYLLAFGSGSAARREILLMVETGKDGNQKRIPLNLLYADLRQRYGMGTEDLNIEGAATCGDRIYLFLRKENLAVSMLKSDFIQHILAPDTGNIPPSKAQLISLPGDNGIFSGFSGATEIKYEGEDAILFCASLENTANAIADGAISGSYVGLLIKDEKEKLKLEAIEQLMDIKGEVIPEKIESLVVTEQNDNDYKVLLVSDNDNGKSKLLEANISIKN